MQPLRPATASPADATRDQRLWQIAKARTKFQSHLLTYLVINAGLWALWFFTEQPHHLSDTFSLPWPIWSTVFWGFGVATQGVAAYSTVLNRGERTQREYERLLRQQEY